MKNLFTVHPLPWKVDYWQRCEEWDPRSCPDVVDANGKRVIQTRTTVGHPGLYDPVADAIAHLIVEAANATANPDS